MVRVVSIDAGRVRGHVGGMVRDTVEDTLVPQGPATPLGMLAEACRMIPPDYPLVEKLRNHKEGLLLEHPAASHDHSGGRRNGHA